MQALAIGAGGGSEDMDDSRVGKQLAILDAGAVEVKNDDFWDYDRQTDLEGFNSSTVYDTLAKQSRNVTQTIGKQKEDVKLMYQRIANQTESLKGLWAAKMNLKGTSALATDQDLACYERKLESLEIELERRKDLGRQFEAILNRQEDLIKEDGNAREHHQVAFQSSMREASRLLCQHAERLQKGGNGEEGGNQPQMNDALDQRVALLLENMTDLSKNECKRSGAWGVLGEGTGGRLVQPGSNAPLSRNDLFTQTNGIKAGNLMSLDDKTGLIRPKQGMQMVQADGIVVPIPPNHFVHPQTGHVLPMQSNVAFDPVTSRLVFVTDSATCEAAKMDDPYIPYVPYPVNPHTGERVNTKLKPMTSKSDFKWGLPMSDPALGLHVPILAMTTGSVIPVGGVHTDPVTGLPIPIELGSIMADPNSGQAVPILAVTVDPETGVVVPVGGTKEGSHSQHVPIIPGDTHVDTDSKKMVPTHSGLLANAAVAPSAGSYQSMLDSNMLACEVRAAEAVRDYKEALYAQAVHGGSINLRHEEANLTAAMKELFLARDQMKAMRLRAMHDIERRRNRATILATTGGSPGMYQFPATGQLLPILIGTNMTDPSGSEQEVPIIGAERDVLTGKVMPLAGTMEDPEGAGLVPITIGRKAVDPVTGELSPVIGIRRNPETKMAVPVTMSSSGHRKPRPPPGAVALLEEEVIARRGYWRRQRAREEEVTLKQHQMAIQLMFELDSVNCRMVEKSVEQIDSLVNQLNDMAKEESKRRGAATQEMGTIIPPDVIAILTDGDKTEAEREMTHSSTHVRFSEVIRKFFTKLQQEEKRYKDRIADLEGAMNPDAENTALQRYQQGKLRIQVELREQLKMRIESLDDDHSSLQYAREYSELCANEARVVLTRSALLAGDFDAQLCGVYGDASDAAGQDSQLIPLLKQLIAMLESGGPFYLSPELLRLLNKQDGDQTDITNINIAGAGASTHTVHTIRDPDSNRKKTDASLVKGSTGPGGDTEVKSINQQVNAMLDQSNAPAVVVIGDMSKTKTTGNLTEEEYRDKKKYLFEKQAYEAAKLEDDLQSTEVNNINETLEEFEKKKQSASTDMTEDFRKKLAQAKTESERDKIMMDYSTSVAQLSDKLEQQKQERLAQLREKLLEKRRRGKKDLHNKHIAEAQGFGIPPEEVPDMPAMSHDELDHHLKMTQQQQEKMNAEVKLAKNDLEAEMMEDEEENMKKLMKSLGLNKQQMAEVQKAMEGQGSLSQSLLTMKEKLKQRAGRNKLREMSQEELASLSEEERRMLMEGAELVTEADRLAEDATLMRTFKQQELERRRRAQEAALREALKNSSEDERNRILAQFNDDQSRLASRLNDEKESNLDKIKAKVAAKKRMKEQLNRDTAVDKELDRITKTHAAKDDAEAANVITSINEKLHGEKLTSQQQALIDDQLKKQEQMDVKFGEEARDVERNLEEDLRKQKKDADEKLDQQLKLVLDNHQAAFDRNVVLQGKNISEEEYKKLLEQYQKEQEGIKRSMESERDKQKKLLEQRMAERKNKKREQLEELHSHAMDEELVKQQQERDALNDKLAREVEGAALKESLKGKNGEQAENMIYTVLRQRHMKEAIHLEDQLAKEREAALRKAKADMEKQRMDERDTLLAAFEQEMVALMGNAGSLTNEELNEKKEQLKARQQKQLKDFDDLTIRMVEKALKDILPELDISDTESRLELKDKQLQELAAAMKKYSPVDELRKKYENDAKRNREEMEKFKKDILDKMRKELEKRKEEQRKREEERKQKMLALLKQLEKDLEEEHKRETERQKERALEKERLRKQQLEDRKRRQKEEIEKGNLSSEEKKRLLKEHDETMKKLEENLKQEQSKNAASLAAKLEARRELRKASALSGMEKNSQLDLDEERRRELNMAASGELLFGKESASKLGSAQPDAGQDPSSSSSLSGFEPSGNAEQDWVNLLMMSPLFKQINDLDNLLSKANTTDSNLGAKDMIYGADYSKAYIDAKDAQWECKGELTPVDVNAINPSQFVIYRFGVFLIRLLHQHIDTPEVTLLLASNLPPNNYSNNAFRNSILYEHKRNILFVRKERMDSIGEFVMVIVHSLAHIKAGDLTDDRNVQFMRVFYQALRIVCQDMFFSRSRNTPAAVSLSGANATGGTRPVLEQTLTGVRNPEDRMNVIGELVDMKVDTSINADFAPQKLSQRLTGYESVTSNARLRQQLSAMGGYSTSGDFIAARMAELKGMRSALKGQRPSPLKRGRPGQPISSPRDLLDSQIVDLRTKTDTLNKDLSQVIKTECEIREGMAKVEDQSDTMQSLREKLTSTLLRKEELVRTVSAVEEQIHQKEKVMKKRK